MKIKLLSLFFISLFISTLSMAQNTFSDKKHDEKQTSRATLQSINYSFQKNKKAINKTAITTGRTHFQMPGGFQLSNPNAKFTHLSIKNIANSNSVFIESIANEATKKTMARQDGEVVAREYITEITPLLGFSNEENDFEVVQSFTDNLGQNHLKLQQTFKNIKVYGAELIVHIDKKKGTVGVNGVPVKGAELQNVIPKITAQNTIVIIETDLGQKLAAPFTQKGVTLIPEPKVELIFYPLGEQLVLTHHITAYANFKDRWEYFVDANTGKVIDKYYHTCTFVHDFDTHEHRSKKSVEFIPPSVGSGKDLNGVTRTINTYNFNGTNYLLNTSKPMFNAAQSQFPDNTVGTILTVSLNNITLTNNPEFFHITNSTNTWNSPTAISAHYNADIAYEYFRTTFNRNSINGQGGTIISIIDVADDDGTSLDNAFWNGFGMFYGNGKNLFKPLAGALDVGGHEMSHGVIQNTANLEYKFQAGALNESFADIFGVLIDRDDWKLGEDIIKGQNYPSGAMRDMQNPNNGGTPGNYGTWQPKDMSEYVNLTINQDNGGVHINSGIPNRAFYLFATAIGKSKAEQIYYRTLTTYLTVSSQFIDLRLGVIKAATDLHGANSPEVQAAITAFNTVGITDGAPTDTGNDIPVANGSEFILSVDVDPSNNNTLYISDTNGSNFVALTTTKLYRKPSVADDGSLAIYVTEDKTINAITLDQNNIVETVISDQPIWASIALSKDGSKLAAVRNDVEGSIIIFDLETSTNKTFELYNPTTADGINTGEVLYADALEWDYSGQYLIYDALNRLNNANGANINYWDVGALEVWNNQSNSFGSGTIQKIFTNLPKGVSIGNPSFSKTSGNILAFDYFDETNNEYEVITANIETGTVKTVYQNNKLGFPNYSKNDTKLIFDSNNNNKEVIGVINLASDKLSPQGNATELIPDAIWGIWYTVGNRSTTSSAKDITDFRFAATSPASVGVIVGNNINVTVPSTANRQNLVATFTNSQKSQVYIGTQLQQSGVNSNNHTNALSYKVVAEDGSTKTYTVTVTSAAPNNPNDIDNDGVPNDLDQCPNTPVGSVVDTNGCPKFSLPANNFAISTSGETCIDSNNGSLSIIAVQNLSYTATLTGKGVNEVKPFNSSVNFNNLPGGNYTLCLTVQGQTGYKLCYDIVVAKAESLSVSGKVDSSQEFITLQLKGATQYYVTLNNVLFTTDNSELVLPIVTNKNKIEVKTDKDCQGVYEEEFVINTGIEVFPNPVSDGNLHISVPNTDKPMATIQISTLAGQTILSKQAAIYNGLIDLDINTVTNGIYILYVTEGVNTMTQKIIIKK